MTYKRILKYFSVCFVLFLSTTFTLKAESISNTDNDITICMHLVKI